MLLLLLGLTPALGQRRVQSGRKVKVAAVRDIRTTDRSGCLIGMVTTIKSESNYTACIEIFKWTIPAIPRSNQSHTNSIRCVYKSFSGGRTLISAANKQTINFLRTHSNLWPPTVSERETCPFRVCVCVYVLLLRSVMPCDADARSECMNEMDGLTGRRQNQVEHVNLIDRKKQRIPDENYDLYM